MSLPLSTVKTPIYSNCRLLDADGSLLARIPAKRAAWYFRKGLAGKVYIDGIEAEPLTIRLLEPASFKSCEDDPFYLTDRENRCVCCGSYEALTRHHIVPREFRNAFPLQVKNRSSHDVVPVCVTCHVSYEREAEILKNQIRETYGVERNAGKFMTNNDMNKAIGYAHALIENHDRIPKERKLMMIDYIKSSFDIPKITMRGLKTIAASPRKYIQLC